MKKFSYKVLKSFTIVKDGGDLMINDEESEERTGTTFDEKSEYVDYASERRGFEKTSITKKLIDRGFIKLVSRAEV